MSAWTNGTYTHKGLALLAKQTQGSSLKITRAVSGTGYINPELLATQTAVTGIKQELTFQTASYPETGVCKLPMFLTNSGLASGYTAKQIGLYANDPDEGEILYFIMQSQNGTAVPGAAEMPDYSATWTVYFRYGQADSVSVTVDPSHTVTEDMLNEVRAIAEQGVSTAKQGKVVVMGNAAELPLAGLKLFGKTTQNGTPTPDAPLEIKSVENPTVTVCGKNILKPSGTKTQNGLTLTLNEDGTYTLSGTATGYANLNIGNAYVVAGRKYKPTVVVYSGSVIPAYWNFETQSNMDKDSKGYLSSNVDTMMSAFIYNDTEGKTYNARFAIMLELVTDSETGVYEPYKEEQTLAIKTTNVLNGIPVPSGGNYTDENGQQWICDEVDFARGVYVQRTNRLPLSSANPKTFIGSDGFIYYPMENYGVFGSLVYCTHYDNIGLNSTGASVKFDGFATVDEFNSFVENKHIEIVYILAFPVETALTDAELAAYASLRSFNPVTTVFNDAGAGLEADCIAAQHESGFKMATSKQPIESPNYPGCFYRIVGGEEEWINPPMIPNVAYRTTERWNGKPVYMLAITDEVDTEERTTTISHKPCEIISTQVIVSDGDGSSQASHANLDPDTLNLSFVSTSDGGIDANYRTLDNSTLNIRATVRYIFTE